MIKNMINILLIMSMILIMFALSVSMSFGWWWKQYIIYNLYVSSQYWSYCYRPVGSMGIKKNNITNNYLSTLTII